MSYKPTYCICKVCKQRDRRILPAYCLTCSPRQPLFDVKSDEGRTVVPRTNHRGFPSTSGKKPKAKSNGEPVNAIKI